MVDRSENSERSGEGRDARVGDLGNGAGDWKVKSDGLFFGGLLSVSIGYLVLILLMLITMATYTTWEDIGQSLAKEEIQYSIKLSLVSCTLTAILSLWVAVPIGYLMSRYEFRGKVVIDTLLDIPIVLPPLVVGLGLLILFQTGLGQWVEELLPFTYAIPGVILAQFMVACAFAVRAMRVTFDQINPRSEQVALTLGCSRGQAFMRVVLPEAGRGMISAGTLAWARALGEFGPILVFAGATRMRTEVLPTTVFLELSIGDLEAAVAVSLVMVAAAMVVLILTRIFGGQAGAVGGVRMGVGR